MQHRIQVFCLKYAVVVTGQKYRMKNMGFDDGIRGPFQSTENIGICKICFPRVKMQHPAGRLQPDFTAEDKYGII